MSTMLHIDGLASSVGEQTLKNLFAQFGQVRSVQMYLRGTATSSGGGTVEMECLEDAQRAMSALHRSYLGGILVLVFFASLGAQTRRVLLDMPTGVSRIAPSQVG